MFDCPRKPPRSLYHRSGEDDRFDFALFDFDAQAGVLQQGAQLDGRSLADEVGEGGGQGFDGGATLGRIGGGGDEAVQVEEPGTGGIHVGEEEIVGGAVDVGVHVPGGQGQGQALAAQLELGQVTVQAGDLLAQVGDVIRVIEGGLQRGGGGQGFQEGGEGGDDVALFDVVGMARLARGRFVGVLGAAQPVVFAVAGVACHLVATSAAEDDAGQGGAVGFVVAVAGATGALAQDEGVGVGIPQGRVVGGGVVGADLVPVGEAGVEVVGQHLAHGGVGPPCDAGRAVGGSVEGAHDGRVGLALQEEVGGQGDGGGQVGVGLGGGGGAGGAGDGTVAEGPVVGGQAATDAGAQAAHGAAGAQGLVLGGAHGLDGVEVALADGGLADLVGGGSCDSFAAAGAGAGCGCKGRLRVHDVWSGCVHL